MKKIAVCLSGCGVFDGAEVHESVLTLLAIDEAGAKAICCAPDIDFSVIDHLQKKPSGETRNVLAESARIARGEIVDLRTVRAADVDALVFPGGFGAAKNLCDFADKGAACTVNHEVERVAGEMLAARKPIGAICIAPAMLARIVCKKDLHPKLTIGSDEATAGVINQMGAQHCPCAVTDMVVDEKHKIVTTPAYMLGRGPAEVYQGIRKLVNQVIALA